MTGPTFVDSNILIYAHDADAGVKQERAAASRADLWSSGEGALSTQVLQEFHVNVTRKLRLPLNNAAARDIVRDYVPWVRNPTTPATILRASEVSEIWQISFWDAMVLAATEQCQAAILLTEDPQPWSDHRERSHPEPVPITFTGSPSQHRRRLAGADVSALF